MSAERWHADHPEATFEEWGLTPERVRKRTLDAEARAVDLEQERYGWRVRCEEFEARAVEAEARCKELENIVIDAVDQRDRAAYARDHASSDAYSRGFAAGEALAARGADILRARASEAEAQLEHWRSEAHRHADEKAEAKYLLGEAARLLRDYWSPQSPEDHWPQRAQELLARLDPAALGAEPCAESVVRKDINLRDTMRGITEPCARCGNSRVVQGRRLTPAGFDLAQVPCPDCQPSGGAA